MHGTITREYTFIQSFPSYESECIMAKRRWTQSKESAIVNKTECTIIRDRVYDTTCFVLLANSLFLHALSERFTDTAEILELPFLFLLPGIQLQ